MYKSLLNKTLILLFLLNTQDLIAQIPDFNTKVIQTKMLNPPFENYKDIIGFDLTLEKKLDRTFFSSLNFFSIIGSFQYNMFLRELDNPNDNVKFAHQNIITSLMYGFAYYPIKRRAVVNPFSRLYAGIGGHSQNIFIDNPPEEFSNTQRRLLDYSQTNHKFLASFTSRLNVGVEFNLSHISPWDKESTFSIYVASGINYMTRVNAIDISNIQGDNQVFANITKVENNQNYTVEIGKLHQFSPVFLTFEFGIIGRLLDY